MADLPEDARRAFATTVALITTHDAHGPNVMAAEWTFNVSYEPLLIAVAVRPVHATHDAIAETKEFGVSLCSEEMVRQANLAGSFSKRAIDKLSSELFDTYPARHIQAPLIRGAVLNAECRLVDRFATGDHTVFVGEVLAATWDPEKRPLLKHRGYRRMGEWIPKRDAVSVTATPMSTSLGTDVTFAGGFTSPESEEGFDVAIEVRDPGGRVVGTLAAKTDEEGYYEAAWTIPEGLSRGTYAVVAIVGAARGRGTLEVR